jgi:kynureninase
VNYSQDESFALSLDEQDEIKEYRNQFYIPSSENREKSIYFCGNSLGLQPKKAEEFVLEEIKNWKTMGVKGHTEGQTPWYPFHELLTENTSEIVGGRSSEVVVMNSLTVNIHLLMVSFYRPAKKRFKILIEDNAFPSDRYAIESQIRFHGFDPQNALIVMKSQNNQPYLTTEEICDYIEKEKDNIALLFLGGVNYYTGQVFDMKTITEKGHNYGAVVGFDLAHGIGNIPLKLHDWNVDFSAWCSYKYLNGGPGCLGGIFVHEKHHHKNLPRFNGWWGHNKKTRFDMKNSFDSLSGAEGWQCSNPPILPLASLRASMELFQTAGMVSLREKSQHLTGYLSYLLNDLPLEIITPNSPQERGCQMSIRFKINGREIFKILTQKGVVADWREPDVIRVAPVPFYNTFHEVWEFTKLLKETM